MAQNDTFRVGALANDAAVVAARVPYLFERVGLALTLVDALGWHALAVRPNVVEFEIEHGLEQERYSYNDRAMSQATRERRPVVMSHAGFHDVFAPICENGEVRQMLIAGPFLARAPTAADLIENWRKLTGHYGHPADPEFARYATLTLGTTVFDAARLLVLNEFLAQVAALSSGAQPGRIAELESMTVILERAGFASRVWDAARTMIDPRTAGMWASPIRINQRAELGIRRVPEQAAVGLFTSRDANRDAVEEFVSCDHFQRAVTDLCMARGELVAGQLGDHGITLLLPGERSAARLRSVFGELTRRMAGIARDFGFRIHFGTSAGSSTSALPQNYRTALSAAEHALSRGAALIHAGEAPTQPVEALFELRRSLGRADARRPFNLASRFERYLQAAAVQAGYRLEPTRLHLKLGFERLLEPFAERGIIGDATQRELLFGVEQASEGSRTVSELLGTYRRAVRDLEGALGRPAAGRRENNLRRAVAFIREHLGEPLRLEDVARAGGFAPHYFSRLFKQRERSTFEKYVERLRIERAKQLLARTSVSIETVGSLCGFASTSYFHRVFKKALGVTPAGYRKQVGTRFAKFEKPAAAAAV